MANQPVFQFVCNALVDATNFSDLESRGTMRIALKQAGLDPRSVSSGDMAVVLQKVTPGELEQRGIDQASHICGEIVQNLKNQQFSEEQTSESPEAVFSRLGS